MRLLSRPRELKRLDAIFKSTRQRATVRMLDSMLWLRGSKAEPVRKVEVAPAAPSRRSPIDFGLRPR
ncbi:MAG: hypothetical protein KIT25_19665 [Enhydrobacter sp.]|nr:MAG: hypothetical protein KIT25_19665 [Enhydrobacter sp.]